VQEVVRKPYRGKGMEGRVARWYARTRRNDLEDFKRQARAVASRLQRGCDVLEVAPGPGFFAMELAQLGDFRVTGLDVSRTFVEIATQNVRNAGLKVDFRHGNASAMPFADNSFDFVYCSAAFKNFSEPIRALDEMYRILRPGGEAMIADLRKDASIDEIDRYVRQSGRSWLDGWMTKLVFRHVLLKRAYTRDEFNQMAEQSRFGACRINSASIGFEVQFTRTSRVAVGA